LAQASLADISQEYHSLAMAMRPICEPVELPPGISLIAERVIVNADASDVGRFLHFHDVAELVLFRRISGTFMVGGQRHRIKDGSVVFVPSMRHHDFELEHGAKEWVLVQFDPYLVETLGGRAPRLSAPFCASPDHVVRSRLNLLADWLIDAAGASDPKLERIAELLLLAIGEAPEPDDSEADTETAHVERLLPALELLRAAPAEPITLETAATACHVSPAYFSRRFGQLFGMTFTEYARTYRLRLAARRLANSGSSISEIAYGVGFSSPAHFTARFRERFGMTPREYRASARLRSAGGGE
jgi:AraC-like DNA-binding protein